MKKRWIVLVVSCMLLFSVSSAVAAPKAPNPNRLNAQFISWQEKQNIIHIMVFSDHGRAGGGPAVVEAGQPLIFGFEWGVDTLENLQAYFIDGTDHDIMLSVNGGPDFSVRGWYQAPFDSTISKPAWSWDHDGDGLGDGDGDGIGDWAGNILFFRYFSPGLASGTHEFTFTVYDFGAPTIVDTITVVVP